MHGTTIKKIKIKLHTFRTVIPYLRSTSFKIAELNHFPHWLNTNKQIAGNI
jgi:hypothetical protein